MASYELNTKGLLCPMPIIKTQQMVQGLIRGDILTIYCTDPGTQSDIPAWCRVHGHTVLNISHEHGEILFTIQVE